MGDINLSHRAKIILFAVGIIVIGSGIFAFRSISRTVNVPQEFSDARMKGALIAQQIVDIANQSKEVLTKIEIADRDMKYDDAVRLVEDAIRNNHALRASAVELALELQRMTTAIPDIQPVKARLLALDAVNIELTLVGHLITHNDYLFQLFQVLEAKFAGNVSANEKIDPLLQSINAEITMINELNQQFTDTMAQFDKLTR